MGGFWGSKAGEFAAYAGVSVAYDLAVNLKDFDPARVADWRLWAVAFGGLVVRSAAGAAVKWFVSRRLVEA